MSFKRYSSIENHYRGKTVRYWLSLYPELKDMEFVVREKVDGANIQLYFEPNKPYRVGKRSKYIDENENFFDIHDVLQEEEDYALLIENAQKYVDINNVTLRLYGEIFGPGIQKRIDYGDKRLVRFFDARENDIWLTDQQLYYLFFNTFNQLKLLVHGHGVVKGIEEALEFDVEALRSRYSPSDDIAEGVIITPLKRVLLDNNGDRFILKKKSEKFSEKMKVKHKKNVDDVPKNVLSLYLRFGEYINENRVLSVFSKEGEIEEPKQMGFYIKCVLADVKEDFLKDYPEAEKLDKKQQKYIYNYGKNIANVLRKYL